MQYLLTQEEYNNLVPKSQYEQYLKYLNIVSKELLKNEKFTCRSEGYKDYCDDCPLVKIHDEQDIPLKSICLHPMCWDFS